MERDPMTRRLHTGNAIMEYALPLAVVLATCAMLATVGDIQKLMARFFMSASGHTQSDLKNGVLEVNNNPGAIDAQTGTGAEGFSSLGGVSDGDGRRVGGQGTPPKDESTSPDNTYWEPGEN